MAELLNKTEFAHLEDGRVYRVSRNAWSRSLEPSCFAKIVTWVVLVAVLVYFLFPIYWLIISSTKTNADLGDSNGLWFAHNAAAENYQKLMGTTNGHFWRWVANSVLYSTAAGAIGTLVSVMAGYGMAKFKFFGRNVLQLVVMAGLLLPIALLTIPLYIVMHSLGLTDTIWSIILPSCVSPFGVFLGRMYAQTSVPDALLEFIFVATWNNFLLPLMMVTNNEQLKPVTLGLYGMMSYFSPTYGAVLQGALFGVLPLMALFLFLQRYWQSGLAAGSVKG